MNQTPLKSLLDERDVILARIKRDTGKQGSAPEADRQALARVEKLIGEHARGTTPEPRRTTTRPPGRETPRAKREREEREERERCRRGIAYELKMRPIREAHVARRRQLDQVAEEMREETPTKKPRNR